MRNNSVPPARCVLTDWNIVVNNKNAEEHFIGFENESGRDRLSTPIEEFDESTGLAITLSGSIYQVIGTPSRPSVGALMLLQANLRSGNLLIGNNFRWKYNFDSSTNEKDIT